MNEQPHNHSLSDVSGANGGQPSLDAQETTRPSNLGSNYRAFLVSGIPQKIEFVERVYRALDDRDDKTRTQAFNACRSIAWFVRHRVSGKIRLASSRCNLRWCPLCIKTKRFVMKQSIIPWIKNAKKPKFITLTLRHSESPLVHQIESLYGFFRILRRRPYWKDRIKGGVWFFQITRSKTDGLWHPHLHIISEGRYFPHSELSGIWSEITHGSDVVDIRAVKDPKKAAAYVSRYASAPCKLDDLSLDDAIVVVDSLKGRRLCGTFGTAKGMQLVPKKCPDADDWDYMCSLSKIFFGQNRFSPWYKEVYEAFVQDRFCESYPNPPDRPAEGNLLLIHEPETFKQHVFNWSNYYDGGSES